MHKMIIYTIIIICFFTGCGTNKFQQELSIETISVKLAREVEDGGYDLITTDELNTHLKNETPMVLIDAMPYDGSFSKSHIRGAKNFLFPIPLMEAWDQGAVGNHPEKDYENILGEDKSKLVIVYCGFTKCTRSHNGAVWAQKLGYTNVKRYAGGIYAWKGAGFPTVSVK